MEKIELEKSFFKIQYLPLPINRKTDINKKFQTYCVKLDHLDFIDELEDLDAFEIQAFLYDQKFSAYIGSCWKRKLVPSNSKSIKLNNTFYFYTSIPGKELILVLEVLACGRSLGWLCFPFIEGDDPASSLEHAINFKLPLLMGSPLALLVVKEGFRSISLSNQATGMEITLTLMPYPLVLQIAHLVPENILIDTSDMIPGIMPCPAGPGMPLKPHLQKCITHILSGICIRIHPSIKEFEKSIIENILEQQQDNESKDVITSKTEITQRRLQVGVHNGYTFIQECDIYHLLVEPIVTPKAQKTHQRSSSMGSINFSRETGLTLRSDVKMPNVPDDPNITIVFFLEYTVSLPNESKESISMANSINKSSTSTISVAWGHVKLGSSPSQTVRLVCDGKGSPFDLLFLRMTNVLELSFSSSPLIKQSKNSSGHSVGDYGSVNSFSTKTYVSPETSYLHSPATSIPGPKHKSVGDIPAMAQISSSEPWSHSYLEPVVPKVDDTAHLRVAQNELERHRAKKSDSNLQEVTLVSSSLPLVPPVLHKFPLESSSYLKVFGKVYGDQLEPVLDHRGQPAAVLDLPYSVNKQLELSATPQQNECSLRILAISGLQDINQLPDEIFFTFQFYRFLPIRTESLVLKPLSEDDEGPLASKVFAVMKPGQAEKCPGFQVTYKVDPSELGNDEYKPFLHYLLKQTLHIDLWNGQSLLYFGTVLLPLKYFCRQGKDAVTVTLEVDIVDCEFPDESLGEPLLVSASKKGKLHLKLSCVRYPLAPKSLDKLKNDLNSDSVIIYPKNSSSVPGPVVCKARPLVETNRELTHLLASRSSSHEKSVYVSEERKRKLARMEAVLKIENKTQSDDSERDSFVHFLKEREQDLLMIESYIQKNKTEMIESLLHVSVTRERTIYPIIGTKSFFEFVLENPFPEQKRVSVMWKCPELRLVPDLKSWQEFRTLHGLPQRVETQPFTGDTSLVLKAKDIIHIPFTYYNCSLLNCKLLEVFKTSTGHYFTSDMLTTSPVLSNMIPYTIKVRFMTDDQVLLAVLILHVQTLPPSPTHVFKFLSVEHSMFKKCIRVQQSDAGKLSATCSSSEATCSLQENWEEDIQILVKTPTKAAGQSRDFCIFLYRGNQQLVPFQVWHITICPFQRVDLACVSGQLMRSSLLIRGSHVTHLVQCFSSSSSLRMHPSQPFLLAPFVPQELSLCLRPLIPGTKYFQITMVNQSLELILQSWLLVLSCQKPSISKAFQVHLNTGKEVTKRITYTNSYKQEKLFILHSSHPQLLHLWEEQFTVAAHQSHPLGLHFPAQHHIFTKTIFLYLNDQEDKNEETYCIKVTCQ